MIAFFASMYFYSLRKLVELNQKRLDQLTKQSNESEAMAKHYAELAKAQADEAASHAKQVKMLSKLL